MTYAHHFIHYNINQRTDQPTHPPYYSSKAQCEFFVYTPCDPLPVFTARAVLVNEGACTEEDTDGGNSVHCTSELKRKL